MNRSELISAIARTERVPKETVCQVIRAMERMIMLSLECGEPVKFQEFGTFDIRESQPTRRRHPVTGEMIEIEGSPQVVFRPGKKLRRG